MTDEEFAKEVAEKVWGWDDLNAEYLKESYGPNAGPFDIWLRQKVNSWSGFGRTVEAMAERGWKLDGWKGSMDDPGIAFIPMGRTQGEIVVLPYYNGPWPSKEGDKEFEVLPKLLIKATHQAALDAVKGKDR